MTDFTPWTPDDAKHWIAVPKDDDDKYSRGVLGMVTGHPERGGRLENSVKFDRESKKEKK